MAKILLACWGLVGFLYFCCVAAGDALLLSAKKVRTWFCKYTYFRKQPCLWKSKASLWRRYLKLLLLCFQDFSLVNHSSELGCNRSFIAVVWSYFQLIREMLLCCFAWRAAQMFLCCMAGWLSSPQGKILKSVQAQTRTRGYLGPWPTALCRWGCQLCQCF